MCCRRHGLLPATAVVIAAALILTVSVAAPGCGGSSCETPPPLEPSEPERELAVDGASPALQEKTADGSEGAIQPGMSQGSPSGSGDSLEPVPATWGDVSSDSSPR